MILTQGNSDFQFLKSTPLHEASQHRSARVSVSTTSCLKRSFDFRRIISAPDSHTGCVANNTVLETVKWHKVITKRYQIQVSSDLKRQVI